MLLSLGLFSFLTLVLGPGFVFYFTGSGFRIKVCVSLVLVSELKFVSFSGSSSRVRVGFFG